LKELEQGKLGDWEIGISKFPDSKNSKSIFNYGSC
jgi:hypothetical protein